MAQFEINNPDDEKMEININDFKNFDELLHYQSQLAKNSGDMARNLDIINTTLLSINQCWLDEYKKTQKKNKIIEHKNLIIKITIIFLCGSIFFHLYPFLLLLVAFMR